MALYVIAMSLKVALQFHNENKQLLGNVGFCYGMHLRKYSLATYMQCRFICAAKIYLPSDNSHSAAYLIYLDMQAQMLCFLHYCLQYMSSCPYVQVEDPKCR